MGAAACKGGHDDTIKIKKIKKDKKNKKGKKPKNDK